MLILLLWVVDHYCIRSLKGQWEFKYTSFKSCTSTKKDDPHILNYQVAGGVFILFYY
jgi:hypothetical protein